VRFQGRCQASFQMYTQPMYIINSGQRFRRSLVARLPTPWVFDLPYDAERDSLGEVHY
jgi:hypothetical protein